MKPFKKDDKPDAAPAQSQPQAAKDKVDELPDELPSLASEIADDSPKSDDSPKKDAVPEDLPSLDAPKVEAVSGETAPKTESAQPEQPKPVQQEEQKIVIDAAAVQKLSADDNSFFQDIFRRINENKSISENLLVEMKNHWDLLKKETPPVKPPTEIDVENKINAVLLSLKDFEKDWVSKRAELKELQKKIKSIEIEVILKNEELKKLLSKREKIRRIEKTYESVTNNEEKLLPVEKGFHLKNGSILRSLADLAIILSTMSDGEFSSYVDDNKNDFANWVFNSLNEADLSAKIKSITSRELMRKVIVEFVS
ncbi:hypothetical protein JXA85_00990 [Candidatus Woesearchaeota archaeon]|nr:hypothetical protein [Candidatus Woesearchaeota archaeon]